MTIKLLWLPGRDRYGVRVFAGERNDVRPFIGELTLPPDEAAVFRQLLFLGQTVLGEVVLSETGWVDPAPAS